MKESIAFFSLERKGEERGSVLLPQRLKLI